MNELKVTGLTKRYGEKVALNDFSYTFTDGVYGLLGPNGAGKSTMMNILTDNVVPENGEIQFNGVDRKKNMVDYRSCLGFMPQQQQLYASMSLERFLFYMAALKGIKKEEAAGQIDDILKVVNLEDVRRRAMGTFSGGMKQRALIAQATLGNPSLLILDEPTAGLDPAERIRIRNLISEISFNRIVIIATHITSEIEMIAKEVLFLQQGHLKESGDVSTVCERIQGKVFEVQADIGQWKELVSRYLVSNIRREGDRIVMRIVADRKPDMPAVEVFPTLEDVYLSLYGKMPAVDS